jgi:hypothetical protein
MAKTLKIKDERNSIENRFLRGLLKREGKTDELVKVL